MIQKHTYTIDEFCQLHNISRTTFYSLMKQGNGPAIMKVGRRTLISVVAAEKWRNSLSNFIAGKSISSEDGKADVL